MRGKFIVLEGCEGSGKSSVVAFLRQMLGGRSDIVFTREPGGTRVSEAIRDVLMDKGLKEMTPLTELFLFCAARAQHIEELIRPTLESGDHVVCDRFEASTVAYQLHGRERIGLAPVFRMLNFHATGGLTPDVVIYLDVEPEVGLRRKDGLETRFDEENIEFHGRVRKGFLRQMAENVIGYSEWRPVYTTHLAKEQVRESVLGIIKGVLGI
mgnify:FL=1